MSAVEAVMAGRVEAESLMQDWCVVTRPGEPFTDADGVVVTPVVQVYAGRCRVQSATAQAASPVAGGHAFTVERLQLQFPATTPLQVDDSARITVSALDPTSIGQVFRLVELARGSHRTAARWNAELVTA